MKAKFIGKHMSMGYQNGAIYVLATTYDGKYWWIADINGIGKPTPYSNINTFLDNWRVLDMPTVKAEGEELLKESMKNFFEEG